jgi:hypothetical protein
MRTSASNAPMANDSALVAPGADLGDQLVGALLAESLDGQRGISSGCNEISDDRGCG